ncbi:hypothetical protein [Saccharophagus degradans]|uniref:Uncharacterized protein n=1 Tax=Saccharophagus degradans (strain 2-40 / ATCC 43961 / DSM 17024) TaxID=203122 RepID=Q21H25_SACD2|nr:hypothetical protein [Saccharophagus degradans]ABD82004.1 hypothetical protein Sde_2744 [Saccharophagus degradans 2-40]
MLNDTDSRWIKTPVLKTKTKEQLANLLKINVDSSDYQSITEALEIATIIQKPMSKLGLGLTQTEFKKALISIKGHLEASLKSLREIPDSYLQLLEQSCWYANNFDKNYITPPKDRSSLIDILSAMLAGIDFHLQNMNPATKEKHVHTAGIAYIRDKYSNIFKDKPISAHRNSIFTKLVTFWIENYLNEPVFQPQRQVEKVLG